METPYKTPGKTQNGEHHSRKAALAGSQAKAVDLVTGKAQVEYFFDPSLVLNEASSETPFKSGRDGSSTPMKKDLSSALAAEASSDPLLYESKHLFAPCSIVKTLEGSGTPGITLVKTTDGTLHKIVDSSKLIQLTAPDDYIGMNDVLHLSHVTEASLLHTLRLRYKRDDIYTSAGPILMSINPYKAVTCGHGESLYSEKKMIMYRNRELGKGAGIDRGDDHLPPHLFEVADRAYSALIESAEPMDMTHMEEEDALLNMEGSRRPGSVRSQSIIISGESGAGKTEATKIIMQYLSRITKSSKKLTPIKSPDGKMMAALEDRVLSSNPLLESFGNARTLRNDNSSRFGKFIRISFSAETGHIEGATISNYLLEKTRITTQVEGERNYHIFYQLLTGAGQEMLEELGLEDGVSGFRYLGNRDVQKSRRDVTGFAETRECLSGVGLGLEEQRTIFRVLAAVLHLGNIDFEEKGDDSSDGDDGHGHNENAKFTEESLASLSKACSLLGLDQEKVSEAVLTKLLSIGGKTIHKPQSLAQASDKRDAFAKLTYSSLFVWLVKRVNSTISASTHGLGGSSGDSVSSDSSPLVEMERESMTKSKAGIRDGFIGVLDIYGFESFEVNGFEQFLINYCNEKLQRHFNRHLFEVEQDLYESEGVDWSYITFNDNRPCLELIEGGGGTVGILNTLDDAWGGMGTAAEKDVNFMSNLHSLFGGVPSSTVKARSKKTTEVGNGGHPYFVMPKFGADRQFVVIHYAGEVKYTANGFVEKNMESLSNELKDLGVESSVPLAKGMYMSTSCQEMSNNSAGAGRRSTIRGVSVGSQFRSSLQSLVSDLEHTQPHYIRCIKPNLSKEANSLDSGEVLRQLRYAGMMETIRIRREGYALREEHKSFYNRFSMLLNPEDFGEGAGISQLVNVLSKRLTVTDHDWQIGHSKIFLRRELADKLERLAKLKVHAAARRLGRFGRLVAQRRAAMLLTAWARFRLHMLKKNREDHAVSAIAASYRGYRQLKIYAVMQWLVIQLQSFQRRKLAVDYVKRLRDPYGDMSFKELQQVYLDEQSRLEEAVKSKDFVIAAQTEASLDTIKEVMESKRPLTRSVLESKIEEVQKDLDNALSSKTYTLCGPLQEKLESLIKKRVELPTIEELRDAVRDAEADVAVAAKNRDFAAAASGQARIDEANRKLREAMDAEGLCDDECADDTDVANDTNDVAYGIASRADLEREIESLNLQIRDAIQSKDFNTASSLQPALDEREALREFFPTADELKVELDKAKGLLEESIGKKDFAKASALNEEIDALEKKLEAELELSTDVAGCSDSGSKNVLVTSDGEEKTIESRAELEQEINATKALISDAVKSKQFKRAESLQTTVDEMEGLRSIFPSVAELQTQLMEQKQKMDEAISNKKFSVAEEINLTIEETERKLEVEKSKAPEPPKPLPGKENVPNSSDTLLPTTTKIDQSATAKNSFNRARKIRQSILAAEGLAPRKENGIDTTNSSTRATNKDLGPKTIFESNTRVATQSCPTEANSISSASAKGDVRPVSKLRPKKPLLSTEGDSILSVAQMLASKRGDASLVVGSSGGLAGIITDTDVTRRVVAKHVDPASTSVSEVMTSNPTCVSMSDSAMDAMGTMVENHFRHLPVVDESGAVVGLLDIAKCLNDAISKLERAHEKSGSAAEDAVEQMASLQGAGGAQAAALQALLGPLLTQAFGGKASPSLRSLLAGKPATIVSPEATVLEAAEVMSESRKAALVVEDGHLVGIFGFKDMMNRVVAKELPLEETTVSEVMTPNPESVSPDITVLDALQIMHDDKFLTLPVCEKNGSVVGLVNVMDVIYGCGGAEGWRSVFTSAMEVDDGTEAKSVQSRGSATRSLRSVRTNKSSVKDKATERPVSKLRPKKPLLSTEGDSILSVTQMLASKRGDASLVVGSSGGLAGIITDTDVTRRVVAKQVDPVSTSVSEVMTSNPTCVSMSDSAMDAMGTMVENHFRHLPVVNESGAVVGLLDIAKCLNDAISKLERAHEKSGSAAEDAVEQMASLQGAGGAQAAALQALLGPLLTQAFGGKASPSLRSLLAGKPATIVSPEATVMEAAEVMSESRKAALVVEDGHLVGIFGFKDMMNRVVAKELPLEETTVSEVMTPNPESVSPDITVLEALQIMHDDKFLTLPVCEKDGSVVGLVSVMDVIYGCGGAEGWRSVFNSAMEVDDGTEAKSVQSRGSATRSLRSVRTNKSSVKDKATERPVSKLRPKKPLLSTEGDSILSVAQMLASKRGDASLVVGATGGLAGIITDTDVTRRVVAKQIDPASTSVSEVMTSNPACVSMSDSAMDAMGTMVENHFRHLPVVNESGAVVGLLDIAKCLNDAISKLERAHEKSGSAAEDAVEQMASLQGAGGAQAAALQALLGPLLTQAFGGKTSPSLRSLLAGKPATIVSPEATVMEAAEVMSESRKAALVVEDGHLVGIFGFKDMMNRVVAKELPLEETTVSEVMTPNPESVSPEITVLEALQIMHDDKFLTLPVCEKDGSVVGLVSVMDVIYGCGGAEGWRSIFSSIDNDGDLSEQQSVPSVPPLPASSPTDDPPSNDDPVVRVSLDTRFASVPSHIPSHVEIGDTPSQHGSVGVSLLQDTSRGFLDADLASVTMSEAHGTVFKVVDPNGKTHRIRCQLMLEKVLERVTKKVGSDLDSSSFQLQFLDDEGDAIVITTDEDLAEAVNLARNMGNSIVKLTLVVREAKSSVLDTQTKSLLLGAAGSVLAVGVIAMMVFKPRK